ncbi:DUF2868 domain-containing protein [Alcanivorax sp. IO_7]|nr:DUF2868 domain-containing protein [Alcanivorax sp. IO_7]
MVLPRLALLALSRWHLNRRARRLLRDHPGYAALGERFATPGWTAAPTNRPARRRPGSRTPRPRRRRTTPAP